MPKSTVRAITDNLEDRDRLRANRLATQRADLSAQRKALDEQIATLDAQLMVIAERSGDADHRLQTADFTIKIQRQSMTVLDKDTLLRLGVRPTVIQKATIKKPKKPFIGVWKRGADVDGEDQ